MTITDVRVKKLEGLNKLKASASITIDNCFVVHDIGIIEGNNGLFVAMPNKREANGNRRDIAHPINASTREVIQSAVLEAYENLD